MDAAARMRGPARAPRIFDLIPWTLRRSGRDVIQLYDSLSAVMGLATGGTMLNFGYWEDGDGPGAAQRRMALKAADLARLEPGQTVVDAGCGYGEPARLWEESRGPLRVVRADINRAHAAGGVCADAQALPLRDSCADAVVALESAQHFGRLEEFARESRRVLRPGGRLALAVPVAAGGRLGLLRLTWASERHAASAVEEALRGCFSVDSAERVGSRVYEPLWRHYESHRESISERINSQYPRYVERILHASLKSMARAAERGAIEYMMISCTKTT